MAERQSMLAGHRPTDRQLRYVGAALAYVVAGFHLFHPTHGFRRLVRLAATNNFDLLATDPRPLLFVLSGIAIVTGVLLALWGFPRRPLYVLGMALAAAYVVGFFGWHLTGHGGFLPGRAPVYHGVSPIEAVISHLQDYPIARASKLFEVALFAVLAVLYWRERPGGREQ